MKIITKEIPIYFGFLRIVITSDFKVAVKKLKLDTDGLNPDHYGAFVHRSRRINDDIPIYTIVLEQDCPADLIAHEVVHLVNSVYLTINAQLDRHNDEPQAYLTGWFVKEIYKALKQKGK